jgi:polysaccharide export outer membrane protein
MSKRIFFLLFFIVVIVSSCIPTKDLTYLQTKEDGIAKDSILKLSFQPHRLQVNDVINITIKANDPTLVSMFNQSPKDVVQNTKTADLLYFDGYTVNDHGNIRIPIIGEINVLGYTTEEVRIMVEKKLLENYFKEEANIFATVKLAGIRFTVNGEVQDPGVNVLYQDQVTIMDAISTVGDITMVGNRKEVTIVRQFPYGSEIHTLDLTDVNCMKSPYYFVKSNDFIYIKPLKQKSWGTGTTGLQSLTTIITALSLLTTVLLLIQL